MSTAGRVPETWELDGDDARKTLKNLGRQKLLRDAFMRLRYADGFSHARSLAFATSLVLVQGVIAIVGFAAVLGDKSVANSLVRVAARDGARSGQQSADRRSHAGVQRGDVVALAAARARHHWRDRHRRHAVRPVRARAEPALRRGTGPTRSSEVRARAAPDRDGRCLCRDRVRDVRVRPRHRPRVRRRRAHDVGHGAMAARVPAHPRRCSRCCSAGRRGVVSPRGRGSHSAPRSR